MHYIFVQSNGFKIVHQITTLFERVEIKEQVGEFYKLCVPRENKTIGYLFGFIESIKQEMNIQEYAVSQTSLEQIF